MILVRCRRGEEGEALPFVALVSVTSLTARFVAGRSMHTAADASPLSSSALHAMHQPWHAFVSSLS